MIRFVTHQDTGEWLELAKEVEPLFGEMVNNPYFIKGIEECISASSALCMTDDNNDIAGIIVFNREKNEIEWFAVKNKHRGKGYGGRLLNAAIDHLNTKKPVYVQTFSSGVQSGLSARKLYMKLGFKDYREGGKNPAGIDTVIMKLG